MKFRFLEEDILHSQYTNQIVAWALMMFSISRLYWVWIECPSYRVFFIRNLSFWDENSIDRQTLFYMMRAPNTNTKGTIICQRKNSNGLFALFSVALVRSLQISSGLHANSHKKKQAAPLKKREYGGNTWKNPPLTHHSCIDEWFQAGHTDLLFLFKKFLRYEYL